MGACSRGQRSQSTQRFEDLNPRGPLNVLVRDLDLMFSPADRSLLFSLGPLWFEHRVINTICFLSALMNTDGLYVPKYLISCSSFLSSSARLWVDNERQIKGIDEWRHIRRFSRVWKWCRDLLDGALNLLHHQTPDDEKAFSVLQRSETGRWSCFMFVANLDECFHLRNPSSALWRQISLWGRRPYFGASGVVSGSPEMRRLLLSGTSCRLQSD